MFDGDVVPRKVLTLSLSIDHRVVDGADAARFVNTVKEYLASPELLLLESPVAGVAGCWSRRLLE